MITIDRRALPGAMLIAVAVVLLAWLFRSQDVWIVGACVLVLHLAFFRDPSPGAADRNALLSPASGKISDITPVHESRFMNQETTRIGIFLSVFDVHITRAPFGGFIRLLDYVPGKFINALNRECSKVNESNWIGLECPNGNLVVRQISGAIARKIFCDVKLGQRVGRGQKLGIICYGSRVEIFLPKDAFRIGVKVGDRVRVGHSVLGEWIA